MIKAILTGHSKGLGLGIAQALLSSGYPVLGLSRSTNGVLEQQFPALLQQMRIDLSDNTALECKKINDQLEKFIENATLLLLINNAGSVTPIAPLNAQNSAEISRSIQLNVTSPMVLSAQLTQLLKPAQELRILHVSSGAARNAYPGWSIYCATKAALDMHAQAVKMDNIPNVKICSLAPGVIDTDMQTTIRQTDESLFPNRKRFVQLKNNNELDHAEHTGVRLVNYLLHPQFGHLPVDDLRTR